MNFRVLLLIYGIFTLDISALPVEREGTPLVDDASQDSVISVFHHTFDGEPEVATNVQEDNGEKEEHSSYRLSAFYPFIGDPVAVLTDAQEEGKEACTGVNQDKYGKLPYSGIPCCSGLILKEEARPKSDPAFSKHPTIFMCRARDSGSAKPFKTKTITWGKKAATDCKVQCQCSSRQGSWCDAGDRCKSYRFTPATKKCELFDKCTAQTTCVSSTSHSHTPHSHTPHTHAPSVKPFKTKTINWTKNPTSNDCKAQCECSSRQGSWCDGGDRCKSYHYNAAAKKCELFDKCTAQTTCVTKKPVTDSPVWTPACNEAAKKVCANYEVKKHCGLTYEIWTDGTPGCMTNTARGFKAEWTKGNDNYLARKGVRPGSKSPVVTYSAKYQPNGVSYLAIYGWTQKPLIEYYIVDSWGGWRPPGTRVIGTVNANGGTYDIYTATRVNKPSIEGTKTFTQFWSVRQTKRTSGIITVASHFEAWAKFGLTMGTFYEVSLVIEGYRSSGSADVTVSFK